ncbi:phospholipase A1-II 5-like [Asparagus officinalis]|uniref:phospholipase A1-II 5-like n=1 Tax=Asparagus officinalis TaxID=4686 RepID=UPI00098E4533|nr:phospholipase A1-II 5-like [Asparagus officinalis]
MAPTLAVETSPAKAKAKSSARTATTNSIIVREPEWAELLGSNKWAGLLDPLNFFLRKWLLLWGDMAEVTYDAFNKDTNSKDYGSCLYSKEDLLTKTHFPSPSDYKVVDFLYATAKPEGLLWLVKPGANFQGYIAVSSDDYAKQTGRREIYVAWRGTETLSEAINDLNFKQTSVKPLFSAPPELSPFITLFSLYSLTDWLPDWLIFKLKQLVKQYKDEELSIVCVGHSLGGALAVLSAFDIVLQGVSKNSNNDDYFPVTAVLFACPRIGNKAFRELLEKQPKLNVIHVMNEGDIVPSLPPKYIPFYGDYVDIGSTLELDWKKSPNVIKNPSYLQLHSLQLILHLLAGWNGERGEFEMVVKRSITLLNKTCGFVKPEYGVPANWSTENDKGKVMNEDGVGISYVLKLAPLCVLEKNNE